MFGIPLGLAQPGLASKIRSEGILQELNRLGLVNTGLATRANQLSRATQYWSSYLGLVLASPGLSFSDSQKIHHFPTLGAL